MRGRCAGVGWGELGQVLAAVDSAEAEQLCGAGSDCSERVLEHWRGGGLDP